MDMETVLSQIREKLAATRHHGGEIEIKSKRSKRDKSGKKRSRSQLNKKKERERESLKQLAKETGDDDVEWGKAANSDSQVTIYENAVILNTDPLPPPPPDASTIAPHLLARSEDETSSHGTSSRNSRAASNRNSRRDATASPDKHPCTKRNCHCKSSNRRCMKRK
ncbi:unnamed protein product, partial [Mesorhabditis spiculigera]